VVKGRFNLAERVVLLAVLAALLAVLGLLVAGATTTVPTTATHLSQQTLIPRGEIPFMQTVRALGTTGGGFFASREAQTPMWIIASLGAGFGAIWIVSSALLLVPRRIHK